MRRLAVAVLKKALLVCIGLILSLGVLLVGEAVAAGRLKKMGHKSFPLLVNFGAKPKYEKHLYAVPRACPFVDPHLGYARPQSDRDGGLPGFTIYRSKTQTDGQVVRIVTLGGSTTDAHHTPVNWPRKLRDLTAERGLAVEIVNGGTLGFSSNQELIKLVRDVLPLEPDIVISLNGINDLGFIHAVRDHPMVHPYQRKYLNTTIGRGDPPGVLPNLRRFAEVSNMQIQGVHYEPSVRTTPAEQWQRNVRIMRSVAAEFGVEYVCFLQPVLGQGAYTPSQREEQMMEGMEKYLADVHAFYQEAISSCTDLSFCTDLSDVFSDQTGLFADLRHPLPKGNEVIASAILRVLSQLGLIGNAAASP